MIITAPTYQLNLASANQVSQMQLIHYGSAAFCPENILPVKNQIGPKPSGGFWASPEKSEYGWVDFCRDNKTVKPETDWNLFFKIRFRPGTNILVIDTMQDLKNLPLIKIGNCIIEHAVDFEHISTLVHAIWLTENGLAEAHGKLGRPQLDGWDCECVLIMNKHCCYQVK